MILEWANRLSVNHKVSLLVSPGQKRSNCAWFHIDARVSLIHKIETCDILIVSSPHAVDLLDTTKAKKKFVFCQMAEHLFRPEDVAWRKQCIRFYTAQVPMLSISEWNINLFQQYGRNHEVHYIGNGVNLHDFPIKESNKDGKTILIEGWENTNPSKDPARIGPEVAAMLKKDGYKIIAYSAHPLKTMPEVLNEYHQRPTLEKLNDLYERATILIKASLFDARSCAPMEAMTKGTVTVRGIIKGDDDLTDQNSARCDYSVTDVYNNAKWVITNDVLRKNLAKACIDHVSFNTWDYWMAVVQDILCD